MGLSAEKIAELRSGADADSAKQYMNKILMDVSTFSSALEAHNGAQENYQKACSQQETEAAENASKATNRFLFGITDTDADGKSGWVKTLCVPIKDYGLSVASHIANFKRECLNSAAASRKNMIDNDVGVYMVVDFTQTGPLQEQVLKAALAVQCNTHAVTLGFYTTMPRGYTGNQLSEKEQSHVEEAGYDPMEDAGVLEDVDALLPDVDATMTCKKTHAQQRMRLAEDRAEVDKVLCRGQPDRWYPEQVTVSYEESCQSGGKAKRLTKEGFLLIPAEGGEWALNSKLARGSMTGLPSSEKVVKVSRGEAKRARAEGSISTIWRNKAPHGGRAQRGSQGERIMLEDLAGTAKGKKMLIFVDLFGGAGDRLVGYYDLLKCGGGGARDPLCFFLSVEYREHFSTIARVRVKEQAQSDFQTEALYVEGFCPSPKVPVAWVNHKPAKENVLAELRGMLKILTVSEDLELCIPSDLDVPVLLTSELRATLQQIRVQYPRKDNPKLDPQDQGGALGDTAVDRWACLQEFETKYDVLAKVTKSTFTILLASEKGADGDFDVTAERHFLCIHNHSASKRNDLDAGVELFGGGAGRLVREDSAGFDAFAPSSQLWSLSRPGTKEALTGKEVDAEKADIFTQAKNEGTLRMMSVASALKSHDLYPKGGVWGFLPTIDSKKRLTYKPAHALFAISEPTPLPEVTEDSIGAYLGMRQAADPSQPVVGTPCLVAGVVAWLGGFRDSRAPRGVRGFRGLGVVSVDLLDPVVSIGSVAPWVPWVPWAPCPFNAIGSVGPVGSVGSVASMGSVGVGSALLVTLGLCGFRGFRWPWAPWAPWVPWVPWVPRVGKF